MAASPPTKKRKASATASAASAASTPAAGRCALCAFGASTLDHLLTHVRESHKPADHPGLALDVGRMLIESALAGGALSGATSDWLAAVRTQFEAAAQLRTALARADAAAAAPLLLPLVAGREALAALQQAAQTLLEDDEAGGRTSEHEEAAAEALTGLRRSTSTSSTTAATTATASAAASTAAVASSAAPFASFPSSAPLTITAPPPPLFPSPELFSPHRAALATPGATPGASTLPSLFSRRVSLAPLTSPAAGGATPAAGPQVSSTAAGFVYGGLPPHPLGESAPEGSPTSLTPVFYRPFPTVGDQNAGSSATNRQSPVHQKRKSLAAKGPQPQQGVATPTSAGFQLPSGRAFQLQQMESGAGTPTGGAATPTTPTTPGGTTIPSAARKATPRRWTKEEDDALRAAVESHREKNWKAIAAQVPGRNHTQCLQRWTKVLAPGLVKGHWSPHEDELLRRLVATEQKNWGEVAAKIPGRTSKQCRERWHNHLDPNIVRGAYTPEEDRIILEAQARLGNRWSVIAAMLPGRTEDAVKIRWKSHCRVWRARKYLRKGGNAPDDDGGETPRTPLVQLVGGEFVWPTGVAPLPSPSAAADVKSEQLQQAQ